MTQEVQPLFYHSGKPPADSYMVWQFDSLVAQIIRLIQIAMKIIGIRQHPSLQGIFQQTIIRQAQKIISDPPKQAQPVQKLICPPDH